MIEEEYEKLHQQLMTELINYHNAYVKYIKGKKAKSNFTYLKQSILAIKKLSQALSKELTNVRKGKVELNADKYQVQRQKRKHDLDISRTNR